jgi:rSAM/selenodomain-associated transferase 2/rSAM/selenodomain-associated transferase 1
VKVAVIIPAMNEAQAIGRVLEAMPEWVGQIIVVDNASTDQTAAIAARCGATVVHEPQRGYGAACLRGIAALDGADIVVFLDGDFSDDPQEMGRLIEPILCDDVDMVIGSRALGLVEKGALTPQQRFGNGLACRLMRILYQTRYTDLGPFRAIRYASLRRLAMDDRNYGWTVQMQVRAARLGLRTTEVPVSYRRRIGVSKISGTLRGVIGAGIKIITTIFREGLGSKALNAGKKTEQLIVFARYPEPGRTKTRMIPLLGPIGAALLHRQLIRSTLETARRLGIRRNVHTRVCFTGADEREMRAAFGADVEYRDQGEGDLGQRLQRTTAQAFSGGANRVVVIGTDCPLLTAERLDEAFSMLDRCDVVIGPAIDGGYYLIGMVGAHGEVFDGIDRGGPQVLEQTLEAIKRLGLDHVLLSPLSDVDTPDDLMTWGSARLAAPNVSPRMSIIIPARNEQDHLAATIASVLEGRGVEIIVVDGESTDRTVEIAKAFGVTAAACQPSRGLQLNLGARRARGDWLLFLHADTILPPGYVGVARHALCQPGVSAGAFSFAIDTRGFPSRLIELGVHVRSQLFAQPYGDQALFMSARIFQECDGFPPLPCMEDYAMLGRLKARGRVRVQPQHVKTSIRRWKRDGWLWTTMRHQWAIARYHFGGIRSP